MLSIILVLGLVINAGFYIATDEESFVSGGGVNGAVCSANLTLEEITVQGEQYNRAGFPISHENRTQKTVTYIPLCSIEPTPSVLTQAVSAIRSNIGTVLFYVNWLFWSAGLTLLYWLISLSARQIKKNRS